MQVCSAKEYKWRRCIIQRSKVDGMHQETVVGNKAESPQRGAQSLTVELLALTCVCEDVQCETTPGL